MKINSRVEILSLTQPEDGGRVLMMVCPVCKRISISHNRWAPKPDENGNVWKISTPCVDRDCFDVWLNEHNDFILPELL